MTFQQGEDDVPTAYKPKEMAAWAARAKLWAEGGQPDDLPYADPDTAAPKIARDVFIYFIHEGKIRAPHAAIAFMDKIGRAEKKRKDA